MPSGFFLRFASAALCQVAGHPTSSLRHGVGLNGNADDMAGNGNRHAAIELAPRVVALDAIG
jgi:hypothetical protein